MGKNVDYVQWKTNIFEPTGFSANSRISRGPGVNLELAWAHGVRAGTSRNNIKYVIPSSPTGQSDLATEATQATNIVFPTASLGVVYDTVTRQQRFYQGHKAEVSCVTVHHTGTMVATADMNSNIHMWKVQSLTCVLIIKGLLRDGVQHLAFSPSGDRLVAVHLMLTPL